MGFCCGGPCVTHYRLVLHGIKDETVLTCAVEIKGGAEFLVELSSVWDAYRSLTSTLGPHSSGASRPLRRVGHHCSQSRASLQNVRAFSCSSANFSGMCVYRVVTGWTGWSLSGCRYHPAGAEGPRVREAVAQSSEGETRSSDAVRYAGDNRPMCAP